LYRTDAIQLSVIEGYNQGQRRVGSWGPPRPPEFLDP